MLSEEKDKKIATGKDDRRTVGHSTCSSNVNPEGGYILWSIHWYP